MEDANAKLGARNLKVEAELACKMPALDFTSKGVQCHMRDPPSVDTKIFDAFTEDFNEIFQTDGVLKAVRQCDLAHLRTILHTCAPEEVNVTTPGEGMSALHLAASAGHTEAARVLLGSKKFEAVNTCASKESGRHNALHSAAVGGHEEVVRLLLGSPRFTAASATASQPCLGSTALHLAAWYGCAAVADLLLRSHRLKMPM